MKSYHWPGNIQELENVIERILIVEDSQLITFKNLPENIKTQTSQVLKMENYKGPLDFGTFKTESEKNFIVNALKVTGGKINKTVAQAKIPKNTLLRKIKKYKIDVKDYL